MIRVHSISPQDRLQHIHKPQSMQSTSDQPGFDLLSWWSISYPPIDFEPTCTTSSKSVTVDRGLPTSPLCHMLFPLPRMFYMSGNSPLPPKKSMFSSPSSLGSSLIIHTTITPLSQSQLCSSVLGKHSTYPGPWLFPALRLWVPKRQDPILFLWQLY